MSKINASSAGITARFDADSEVVELTHNSLGSANEIILSNDTTGFLEASKLASATQVKGLDHEPDRPLSTVTAFEEVLSGTVVVNGSNMTPDVDNNSLNRVLTLLDNVPSELSASLVNASQRVSLSVRSEPYTLSLSSSRKRSYRAANELEKFHADKHHP